MGKQMTENLSLTEKRTVIKVCVKALTDSSEMFSQLEILARVSEGLSVTSNYAAPGAGEAAGKTTATVAVSAVDLDTFELTDSMDRWGAHWAGQLEGGSRGRTSLNVAAWGSYLVDAGTEEELDEALEVMPGWVVRMDRNYGPAEAQGWGHACPCCGEAYAEDEEWKSLAPIYGGRGVVVGDWVVYCTNCNFVMGKTQAKVRATRALARLAGSSRLSKKWQAAVKGARKDFMSANVRYERSEDAEDFEASKQAMLRSVKLIEQLHSGEYLETFGTAEEKAAAA